MDTDFNFTLDATYDGLTLKAKCEKYLVEVISPLCNLTSARTSPNCVYAAFYKDYPLSPNNHYMF
jgi:hypothetical protein